MEQRIKILWDELEKAHDVSTTAFLDADDTLPIVERARRIGYAQGPIRAYEILTGAENE